MAGEAIIGIQHWRLDSRLSNLRHDADQLREVEIANATVRAAEANQKAEHEKSERIKLELKLAGRSLTKEQFNILQTLKGKIAAVNVASDVDAEASMFASWVATALQQAGIKVGIYKRSASAHSSANMLYDKDAINNNPNGDPTLSEPLARTLKDAGILNGGVLGRLPGDLVAPPEIPMIIIGGRIPIPPAEPYLSPEKSPSPVK